MMKSSNLAPILLAGLLSCSIWATAMAEDARPDADNGTGGIVLGDGQIGVPERPTPFIANAFTDDPRDAGNQLAEIEERRRGKKGLFEVEPLGFFRRPWVELNDKLYESYGFRAGIGVHNMFQAADRTIKDTKKWGAATDFDVNLNWDLLNRGQPDQGGFFANIEGRWEYGFPPGPQTLGFASLATVGGTANTFSRYVPAFTIRQLFWRQGSREAGWSYQVGKITVDGAFASSRHLNPNTTFSPNASGAVFGVAAADSGLGVQGHYAFNENWAVMGLASDANASRFNFGDPLEGDVFGGAELQWRSSKSAKLSTVVKLGASGTNGTKNGLPANGATGRPGWGISALLEQELAPDGRPVVIVRYSRGFNESAIYDQQVGVQFVLYQPAGPARFGTDALGLGFNWVDPVADTDARNEFNFEAFYRFPLFPQVDLTIDYQHIINPAFTREFDHVNLFGVRLTTTF